MAGNTIIFPLGNFATYISDAEAIFLYSALLKHKDVSNSIELTEEDIPQKLRNVRIGLMQATSGAFGLQFKSIRTTDYMGGRDHIWVEKVISNYHNHILDTPPEEKISADLSDFIIYMKRPYLDFLEYHLDRRIAFEKRKGFYLDGSPIDPDRAVQFE